MGNLRNRKGQFANLKVNRMYRTRDGGVAAVVSTTNTEYGDGLPVIVHKQGIGYAPPYTVTYAGCVNPDGTEDDPWDIIDLEPVGAVRF